VGFDALGGDSVEMTYVSLGTASRSARELFSIFAVSSFRWQRRQGEAGMSEDLVCR
jgi:hypothetical protein